MIVEFSQYINNIFSIILMVPSHYGIVWNLWLNCV